MQEPTINMNKPLFKQNLKIIINKKYRKIFFYVSWGP